MHEPKVVIVLATLNGAAWLPQQLQSILNQSYKNWQLLVSDDGSSDGTLEILRHAASDNRISLLPSREGPPGHVGNFEYLLQIAGNQNCDYIFFADQDDIWADNKVAHQVDALAGCSAHFSDLQLITAEGSELNTFMREMKLEGAHSLRDILGQNPVVGCSLAITSELLELALPFPNGLKNHDWWLAICASATDGLSYDEALLVNYRQHSDNVIGVSNLSRQLPRLRSIVKRQAEVLESKLIAVNSLIERLKKRNIDVPEELYGYLAKFEGKNRWSAAASCIWGTYRPRSAALACVQALASLDRPFHR